MKAGAFQSSWNASNVTDRVYKAAANTSQCKREPSLLARLSKETRSAALQSVFE
jgi:hypothetical protein